MPESIIPLPSQSTENSPFPLVPVSPKFITVRYIGNAWWWLTQLAVAAGWHTLVWYFEWPWPLHLIALIVYANVLQGVLLLPRRTRALGYATRENDLVYRSGLMFRSLSVIPYGRVQDIEIDEGPITRRYGLSSVTVKSAGGMLSDITIPGLERTEAERIRDLVTREAHEKMAAL